MKKLLVFLISSYSVMAFSNSNEVESLTRSLKIVLDYFEDASNGEYKTEQLECGPTYGGVTCRAELTYFKDSGENEECLEWYQYRGGNCYVQAASSCQASSWKTFPDEICLRL